MVWVNGKGGVGVSECLIKLTKTEETFTPIAVVNVAAWIGLGGHRNSKGVLPDPDHPVIMSEVFVAALLERIRPRAREGLDLSYVKLLETWRDGVGRLGHFRCVVDRKARVERGRNAVAERQLWPLVWCLQTPTLECEECPLAVWL